jgi:tyrosinase
MTIPKEWELLGEKPSDLTIKGSRAETQVRLNSAIGQLDARLAKDSESAAREHLYMTLEEIRGNFDAAALRVFINLPEGAQSADHRNLLAGTISLYGLRRASANHGAGLASVLDITPVILELPPNQLLDLNTLRVTIIPHRELPPQADVVVGRIRIFGSNMVSTAPHRPE